MNSKDRKIVKFFQKSSSKGHSSSSSFDDNLFSCRSLAILDKSQCSNTNLKGQSSNTIFLEEKKEHFHESSDKVFNEVIELGVSEIRSNTYKKRIDKNLITSSAKDINILDYKIYDFPDKEEDNYQEKDDFSDAFYIENFSNQKTSYNNNNRVLNPFKTNPNVKAVEIFDYDVNFNKKNSLLNNKVQENNSLLKGLLKNEINSNMKIYLKSPSTQNNTSNLTKHSNIYDNQKNYSKIGNSGKRANILNSYKNINNNNNNNKTLSKFSSNPYTKNSTNSYTWSVSYDKEDNTKINDIKPTKSTFYDKSASNYNEHTSCNMIIDEIKYQINACNVISNEFIKEITRLLILDPLHNVQQNTMNKDSNNSCVVDNNISYLYENNDDILLNLRNQNLEFSELNNDYKFYNLLSNHNLWKFFGSDENIYYLLKEPAFFSSVKNDIDYLAKNDYINTMFMKAVINVPKVFSTNGAKFIEKLIVKSNSIAQFVQNFILDNFKMLSKNQFSAHLLKVFLGKIEKLNDEQSKKLSADISSNFDEYISNEYSCGVLISVLYVSFYSLYTMYNFFRLFKKNANLL